MSMATAHLHLLLAMAALLAVGARSASRPAWSSRAAGQPSYAPGEVLVRFKPTTASIRPLVMNTLGASVKRRLDRRGELVLAALPSSLSVADAVARFRRRTEVLYAEPNYLYRPLVEPNDELFADFLLADFLWGLKGGFGSQATTAWDTTTDCSSVYVGIVDTGIQSTHPDLAGSMWRNAGEVPGDGIDNDGNGFIDDVHGYDFANNHSEVYSIDDGDYHGTHLAGTVAATGNNQIGVAGMCWRANLIAAKFIAPSGGSTADAIRAIDYITDLKRTKGLNIVATVNSWGCVSTEGCFSQALLDAINRGYAQGILFIAAAGNDNTTMPIYPAAYSSSSPAVIAVTSIDSSGNLSYFAFTNTWAHGGTWVHLGAPGSEILSTYPEDDYAPLSGTSMAAPHVAGAAALYKARWPTATADDIRAAILGSVTPTPSLGGGVTSSGGRLNVAAMLAVEPLSARSSPPPPPPPQPSPPPPPRPSPPPPPTAGSTVAFFESCSYSGRSARFGQTGGYTYYNAGKPDTFRDNKLRSLKVPAGLGTVLYDNQGYWGQTISVIGPADVPCLKQFNFEDRMSSFKVVDITTKLEPPATYCYRYASNPARTIFYKSTDCSPKWGFGWTDPSVGSSGGQARGWWGDHWHGLAKYCYRYASSPTRVLFFRAVNNDCWTAADRLGFNWNMPEAGWGGDVWLYPTAMPNTIKFCYRYATNPLRTMFYRSDDCTPKSGWGANIGNGIGSGGEVWAPIWALPRRKSAGTM